MSTTLEELVKLDLTSLKHEVEKLRAIEKWALSNLGIDYKTGDRVAIVDARPSQSTNGWKVYAEALAVGQTGIAGRIEFNEFRDRWDVMVGMDRCWSTSVHDWRKPPATVRYWCGPADETPDGFERPSYYPPEGKIKWFAMPVAWVAKAVAA